MVAEIELLAWKKNDFNASFIPAEHNASIMIINKLRNLKAKMLPTINWLGVRICVDLYGVILNKKLLAFCIEQIC